MRILIIALAVLVVGGCTYNTPREKEQIRELTAENTALKVEKVEAMLDARFKAVEQRADMNSKLLSEIVHRLDEGLNQLRGLAHPPKSNMPSFSHGQ